MNKEVTIYDIAEQLNISASTVSRALNDHPAINEKTKKKINQTASELGYRSNLFAKNLRAKSTMTLGVMVPKLDSYFLATVLAGMEKEANQSGYNLLIAQSLDSPKKEIANAKTMFNSRVDGLLVSTLLSIEEIGHFEPFLRKGIPILFFDRVLDVKKIPKIVIDNFQAGYDATAHLIEQGCKKIFHFTGDLGWNVYRDRYHGYLKALADANVSYNEDMLFVTNLSLEASSEVSQQIAELDDKPDGFFVTNDTCAASLMVSLKKEGIRVPGDIAIIGFNDDPITRIVEPRLSTVHYPGEEMGELAARSLISHLKGDSNVQLTNTIVLSHELIPRGSTTRFKEV
ncbi:LacI family DNA-binding transcriptional regulator [Arcticibacterium luteifluviistationis]|uniref:LacI family transcriptional regulator n=1 Tax=Arcticibacterium luteifluviistationis TaxID=1784714 RepID=A0A2Z4GEY6_9BACT|nr:LacI family DNA-binding transcriptional regulator [Arcticibacterium luteifluviistationis]AWV99922.1 LacI family transcriptional regulator [Arcticibacterium luteifluviistationis]